MDRQGESITDRVHWSETLAITQWLRDRKVRKTMEIVRKRQRIHVEQYSLEYEWNDLPGAGFMFACDKQGSLLLDQITPTARQNLVDCQSGAIAITLKGVRDCSYTYLPAARAGTLFLRQDHRTVRPHDEHLRLWARVQRGRPEPFSPQPVGGTLG